MENVTPNKAEEVLMNVPNESEFSLNDGRKIKNISILAVTTGKPKDGFELISIKLDPPLLSVTGPQRIMEKEKRFSTLPIEIQGLDESTQIATSLDLSQEITDLLGETVVTAQITIQEKRTQKTVKKIPIQLDLKDKQVDYNTLKPKHISVKAEIPLSVVKGTKQLATLFTAKLKIENLTPGSHTVPVEVLAEKGITVTSIEPSTATINFKGTPSQPPQDQGP